MPSPIKMKTKIQFIINPISGGKKKGSIPKLINELVDANQFEFDVWIWEKVDDLESQVEYLKANNYDGLIAVGGDGTINQLAQKLIHSNMFLGFVPMGSGNGLARQLEIPMDVKKAISHLNHCTIKTIDTAKINQHSFINVAGVGFDAKVSKSFASSKKRGLLNYSRCVIAEYRNSTNSEYEIDVDGNKRSVKAFMLSVANGSQWGNDFFVAPNASLEDGLLDLVIMSKPKVTNIPRLVTDLNKQKVEKNPLVEIVKGKSIKISTQGEVAHVDGEPVSQSTDFKIDVIPLSLKVFC